MTTPTPSGRRAAPALPEQMLWPYQRHALRQLEAALERGRSRASAVLAPGTGKTRLSLVFLHRWLSQHPDARATLVSATELLRRQTLRDLQELHDAAGRSLASLHGLDLSVDTNSNEANGRLRVVTLDALGKTDRRDLVVFDDVLPTTSNKSHDGKDLTEGIHLALAGTATPELTADFGLPVFHYDYRRAVLDGFLVDHDPPRSLGQPTQHGLRDAEFLEQIGTSLVQQLDSRVPGTTLLYCLDDDHALQVTKIVRDILARERSERSVEAVLPVTEASAHASVDKLRAAGDRGRVAASGDCLTHGINLPAVDRLVFLRPVSSRSLYDRMLGLAARPYPDLYGPGHDKQLFHILDAVGTCEAMAPFATIRPVVSRPRSSFQQLVDEFRKLDDGEQRIAILEEWIGKLRRQVRPFREHLDREFRAASGGKGVDDLLAYLNSVTPSEARIYFLNNRRLAPLLDEYLPGG